MPLALNVIIVFGIERMRSNSNQTGSCKHSLLTFSNYSMGQGNPKVHKAKSLPVMAQGPKAGQSAASMKMGVSMDDMPAAEAIDEEFNRLIVRI
jgi:hypothetical protein